MEGSVNNEESHLRRKEKSFEAIENNLIEEAHEMFNPSLENMAINEVSVGQLAILEMSAKLRSRSMGRTETAIIAFQARKKIVNRSSVSPVTRLLSKHRSRLLKPFPKHFIRRQTSFSNSWTTLLNPDLLENCCIIV